MVRTLGIVMLMLALAGPARAATWRVELDGTGDFTVIQDAVDAAADGDTIAIGPGRYSEWIPQPVGVYAIAYWEDSRSLTFLGAGRDETILGPTIYNHPASRGIYATSARAVTIADLAIENVLAGVVTHSDYESRNCRFENGDTGIYLRSSPSSNIVDCAFSNQQTSVVAFASSNIEITDCVLDYARIYFGEGSTSANVMNCTVLGGGAVEYAQYSTGVVSGLNATCSDIPCIGLDSGSTVHLLNSAVVGGSQCVSMGGRGTVLYATGNSISGPGLYTFDLGSYASLYADHNDIYRGNNTPYVIMTSSYLSPSGAEIIVGNDYWGDDSSPAALDAAIYDRNDDSMDHITVQYDPIRTESVPARQESFGGLKAMFR